MYGVMKELRDTGTTKGYFDRNPRIDGGLYKDMLRTDEWLELEKRYSP
jgi:hypothetical protein